MLFPISKTSNSKKGFIRTDFPADLLSQTLSFIAFKEYLVECNKA